MTRVEDRNKDRFKKMTALQLLKAPVLSAQSDHFHLELCLLYQFVCWCSRSDFCRSWLLPQTTWTSRPVAVYCHLREEYTVFSFWRDIMKRSFS